MITTHPIRGKVENTSVADSIFDGITYSKGAATMKQLLYLMKEENFSKALSVYFKKY
jgi:aminopeptidase N